MANPCGVPLLAVSNLETYYGPIAALKGISFEVRAGQVVTLLGSNGAGKTTTLRTLSGLLVPRQGKVSLNGVAIGTGEPARTARRGIAHVPEGREVFPLLSVRENLMLGACARASRSGSTEDLERVLDDFPRLRERLNQPAAYLSGGEQQMLAIGRALMGRPTILLLDEPSLGLSPKLVTEIFGIIERLNRERAMTVLLVEQNASVALEIAHFGYVLELGRVALAGTREQLRESEDIRDFYLGAKDVMAREGRRWKRRKIWR
ncbi:ABC transporter ATP-binding protein [Cupriavidus sp. SK-4]|uniref:ABC transporter ATP-binding protein n=1 Tax=Cupriavidus sp. SK-4 TaxID=574750 RepID=UPI00044D3A0A|nr:ABC transporter ATP-binding protein [Cupriavidus sp. SK-4]EYS87555.1 ABC transporter ATP-binding protein [Cupriavidus sp. SK-4]